MSKGVSQATNLIYLQIANLLQGVQDELLTHCFPWKRPTSRGASPEVFTRPEYHSHRNNTTQEWGSRLALQAPFYLKGSKIAKIASDFRTLRVRKHNTGTHFILLPLTWLSYTDNAFFGGTWQSCVEQAYGFIMLVHFEQALWVQAIFPTALASCLCVAFT